MNIVYLIKRLLAVFPTVLGVILLTFLLFNVVGGSPAAVILGERATALSLEEFDESRGYNKPLFFGRWTFTRALADACFALSAGAWSGVEGVSYNPADVRCEKGALELPAGGRVKLPLNFALLPGTVYRLDITSCLGSDLSLELIGGSRSEPPLNWPLEWGRGRGLRKGRVLFETPSDRKTGPDDLRLAVGGQDVVLTAVRLRRGLANRFDSQLAHYFRQLWRLDFGRSHVSNRPVLSMLRAGVGPSLALTAPILLGSLVLSVLLALGCAAARGRPADRIVVWTAVLLMSVNYIVWVVAGQYLLAYRWGWFPVWGFVSGRYLILPVAIGILTTLGRDVRFYRTVMLEEMHRLYVRTARAKGAGRWRILLRHVLPNGLVAVVANVGVGIPYLFAGSLLLETFFGIPGLGRLGIEAIYQADFDVVRALVLLGALVYVFSNLLTDMAYLWVDPRIRLR